MDLSYLPDHKQVELQKILTAIQKVVSAEIVILFGSYARNQWVEDKYDDGSFRYQSDFDILVIVDTKSEFAQSKFERDIEDAIDLDKTISTPVSILVHDIAFINRRLNKAQYFFTDIKKEGIVLYDSEQCELNESRELLPEERKKLAQEDFDYYFEKAEKYNKAYEFMFGEGNYNEAAFLLHQVTERLFTAILLVYTRYKPNTHDLKMLRKLVNSLDHRFPLIFPLEDPEQKRLFQLLRKAYVDARYKRSYRITKDELASLYNKVGELWDKGKLFCQDKINGFS